VTLPELDLYHPWDVPVETAIEIASRCEAAALDFDPRMTNSEGSNIYTQQWHFVHANSNGFVGGYPTSRYSLSCSVIGGQGDDMQRDDWYTAARREDELESAEAVGRRAAERTVRRLDARKLDTLQAPVLFDATLAGGLIGHFVGAVSGGALYRKSSFLLDSLGTPVFAPIVHLREAPHVLRGLSSAPFDDEGVATAPRSVVTGGVLEAWFLSSYSARKLGLRTTGNAGGSHFLRLASRETRPRDDLKAMLTGLTREWTWDQVQRVAVDDSRVSRELLAKGVTPASWGDAEMVKIRALAEKTWEDWSKKTPLAKAAYDSQLAWLKELKGVDEKRFKRVCTQIREDGAYVEAGENDNLIVQKLEANPKALGIFGYSFLEENLGRLHGSLIEGKAPTFENIADGAYPVSRSLFMYVKKAHVGVIPGIKEFLAELTSEKALGDEGYLADKGLIPLPRAERDKVRRSVAALTPLK
jgi:hypothetical protein